jgi:hypothetical protein
MTTDPLPTDACCFSTARVHFLKGHNFKNFYFLKLVFLFFLFIFRKKALRTNTDLFLALTLQVEDIVDSGNTALALIGHFTSCGAASVAMASLLSKPARREVDFDPQYLCFTIPDKFVVGYGLDFAEHLRSLPYVGVLKPEAYSSPSE